MKAFNPTCWFSAVLLFLPAITRAGSDDKLDLSTEASSAYSNYAQKGSYEDVPWVGEVPAWNYYDIFGNHLLEGFYLYGMSLDRNSEGGGTSAISLHPFLLKWMNGLVQVGDVSDNCGILAMVGDRVKSEFTPYTFKQSLYCGVRIDAFFDFFHGANSVSLITSRISNTGTYGMLVARGTETSNGDWLHGAHIMKNIDDLASFGATFINAHHEEGSMPNKFDGALADSFPENTPTALTLYGVNGRCNLPQLKLELDGEYARSQEVFGGSFKPDAGNVATLKARWNMIDQLRFGGESYLIQSRYKTTFSDPVLPLGDALGSGKYLYSLIEDNDDRDEYPENGISKLNTVPRGDFDGVIPLEYDKDKNGKHDFEEDFLSYDCDPPRSKLYFDRNNNGVPDDIEDDAYPDYPHVPSYYLPRERYLRYDDLEGLWKTDTSDGQVSKGLLGFHLYGTYTFFQDLDLTLGGIMENSEKNSFQKRYEDTTVIGTTYDPENATTFYSLVQYKKDMGKDKYLTIQNYARKIQDNIPNHTQTFSFGMDPAAGKEGTLYNYAVDQLDYRDAFVEMLIAEYTLFKNRGFNFTTRGKYEFTKHLPHLDFNYQDANISSATLVNKCQYIYLLPVLKDMFLIPKFKDMVEFMGYGPRSDLLDNKYRRGTMSNAAYLVYEWKFTQKTAITSGLQFTAFNDFFNNDENFYHGNFTIQLLMKDRYTGLNTILTTGFSKYRYTFYNAPGIAHNPLNNPHRITDNISSYDWFLKIHCGF